MLRNITYIAAIIALLTFSYGSYQFAAKYTGNRQPEFFSVSGTGKVFARADIAQFSFSVITEGKELSSLYTSNDKDSQNLVNFLLQNNIEERDIKTTSYNVNPRYQYFRCEPGTECPPPEIVGYSINKRYAIKARKLEQIDKLLAGIVQKGADNVSSLNFTIDEPDEYQAQARKKAITDAKQKAKQLAKDSGLSLGRLVSVSEGFRPEPIPRVMMLEAKGFGDDSQSGPSTLPGENEIRSEITLRYEVN